MKLTSQSYVCDPRPNYPLLITAKRYRISEAKDVDSEALTLIFAHATGYHKEHWEPTIEHLFDFTHGGRSGRKIQEIWCIDAPNHGEAAILNERTLQWGYSRVFPWEEYARSVHIFLTGLGTGVNVDFSRRNLVGIGHSMGATAVLLAGTYSPNLMFSAIILVDPMLLPPPTKWDSTGLSATLGGGAEKRRDTWASREEAMSIFKSKMPWKNWDPRVLRIYVEYGLRELPTAEYPDKTGVTLACHKTQEAACFRDQLGRVRSYNLLPVLCDTIPVHFIYGAIDDYLPSEVKADILNVAARGKYASDTRVKGVGHLVPQVQPAGLADAIWTALNHRSARHETAQSHL